MFIGSSLNKQCYQVLEVCVDVLFVLISKILTINHEFLDDIFWVTYLGYNDDNNYQGEAPLTYQRITQQQPHQEELDDRLDDD